MAVTSPTHLGFAPALLSAGSLRPLETAYRTLKRRIVLADLAPGTALTELGTARDLGLSQGTIREALMRLQLDGLVQRMGHRGTVVTGLEPEEAREIVALRRRLEIGAVPRAVERFDGGSDTALRALRAEMDAAVDAADEYRLIELDTEFHLTLFRAAGREALEPVLVRLILHSHRSKLWAPGRRRALVEVAARHDCLLAAALARDAEGLATALGAHIDSIVTGDGGHT